MGLRRRRAAVLALVALIGAGCTASDTGANSSSTTILPKNAIAVQNGGTVTVAVSSLPSEFNPWTPSGQNAITAMVMAQVWPQAFVVNGNSEATAALDSQGTPSLFGPQGAELVSIDPETVVYSINEKARWSDGVRITAADFIYNWREQLIVGPSLSAVDPLSGYQDIKSVKSSNNGKTVTVVFSKPYADWESLFSNLVPAHIAIKYGWQGAFDRFDPNKVISGGPFMIEAIVPGRELILSRNPHYWGHPAQLDRIIFRVVRSRRAILAGLADGTIDVAQLAPGASLDRLITSSGELVEDPSASPVLWQLDFNLASSELNSESIRQGIAVSIDRHQLVTNTVGFSAWFVQSSGNRVYSSGAPGSQGNDSAYAQVEMTEAQTLFAQAGDVVSANGFLLNAYGSPVVLSLVGPKGNAVVSAVEEQLQSQLLQVGITLTVHNVSQRVLLDSVLPTGDYELALVPYLVSAFPSTTAALYTTPVGPTPVVPITDVPGTSSIPSSTAPSLEVTGDEEEPDTTAIGAVTRNVLGYNDPTVTALFAEAASELNATSEADLYNEIDIDLWRDMPTLPLFQIPTMLVTRYNVVNVTDTQTLVGPLWDAQNWAIQLGPPPTTTTTTPSSQ